MYNQRERKKIVFTVYRRVFHSILKLKLCRHPCRRRDQIIPTCRYGKNMPTTALLPTLLIFVMKGQTNNFFFFWPKSWHWSSGLWTHTSNSRSLDTFKALRHHPMYPLGLAQCLYYIPLLIGVVEVKDGEYNDKAKSAQCKHFHLYGASKPLNHSEVKSGVYLADKFIGCLFCIIFV